MRRALHIALLVAGWAVLTASAVTVFAFASYVAWASAIALLGLGNFCPPLMSEVELVISLAWSVPLAYMAGKMLTQAVSAGEWLYRQLKGGADV